MRNLHKVLVIFGLGVLVTYTAFASDTVKIQVLTNETTPYGEYRDAIYYSSLSEYESAKSDGSHEGEKLKRVANYVNAVQNPPAPYEPTKEELQEAKASLEAQIVELDAKIVTAKPKSEKIVLEEVIA